MSQRDTRMGIGREGSQEMRYLQDIVLRCKQRRKMTNRTNLAKQNERMITGQRRRLEINQLRASKLKFKLLSKNKVKTLR